jgi:uncharacterized Tic20 family protein
MPFGGPFRGDRFFDEGAFERERTYAMFMHLTCVLVFVIVIPVVVPLIMWLAKRYDSPFLDDHGKEAVHFQLSLFLYGLLLIPIGIITLGVGAILGAIGIFILGIVGTILGAQAANRGEYFRYPMTMRFF